MQTLFVQIFLFSIMDMICSKRILDIGHVPEREGLSVSDRVAQLREISAFDITPPIRTILRSDLYRRQTKIEVTCTIDIQQLNSGEQPLIIDPFDPTKFIYPNEDGKIFFEKGAPVLLSCANTGNHLKTVPDYGPFKIFTCHHDTMFEANNNLYNVNDLRCQGYPKHDTLDRGYVTKESTSNNQFNDFHKYEIGFLTDSQNNFLKLIEIFHNDDLGTTMYVKSEISKFIAAYQSNRPLMNVKFDRTYCSNGRFSNINDFYNKQAQLEAFEVQLGDRDRYLNLAKKLMFNRGHLTPRSSMIYKAARAATCSYLNSAPQWFRINSGNWNSIEKHVIEMAKTLKKDLTVYTGVHGHLQLKSFKKSAKGALRGVYLHAKRNGQNIINKELRIPLYFVKIVVEPRSNKGVVYVTVNNPHDKPGSKYHLCDNPFITHSNAKMPTDWEPENQVKGYSYACAVSDFLSKSGMIFADNSLDNVRELLYIPN